jgi:hypothetical protein
MQYFGKNYKGMKPLVFILLVASIAVIPLQFNDFIQYKTLYARENIFIRHMSGQIPPSSRIIVDGGLQTNLWESYMSQFSYSAKAMGRHYEVDPSIPISSRKMFRDLDRWINKENRPVFLYLTTVDLSDVSNKYLWYFEHLELKLAGGYGLRRTKKSYMLYEITGVKDLPYFEGR